MKKTLERWNKNQNLKTYVFDIHVVEIMILFLKFGD